MSRWEISSSILHCGKCLTFKNIVFAFDLRLTSTRLLLYISFSNTSPQARPVSCRVRTKEKVKLRQRKYWHKLDILSGLLSLNDPVFEDRVQLHLGLWDRSVVQDCILLNCLPGCFYKLQLSLPIKPLSQSPLNNIESFSSQYSTNNSMYKSLWQNTSLTTLQTHYKSVLCLILGTIQKTTSRIVPVNVETKHLRSNHLSYIKHQTKLNLLDFLFIKWQK